MIMLNAQQRIAEATLQRNLSGTRAGSDMTVPEAYKLIFGISLADRCRHLMAEYPEPIELYWELRKYGYGWEDLSELLREAILEETSIHLNAPSDSH